MVKGRFIAKGTIIRYSFLSLVLVTWLVSCSATPERQSHATQYGDYNGGFSQAGLLQNRESVFGEEEELLRGAGIVLQNMIRRSRQGIPRKLLRNAKAIVIVPNLLVQAVTSGDRRHARGIAVIRSAKTGKWERPIFIRTSPTDWGVPTGAREVRLALLALTEKGVKQLFGAKFNQGAAPKVSFGPRSVASELNMQQLRLKADIYAYAKVQRVFAGLAFKAPAIAPDKDSDHRFYGRPLIRETDGAFSRESVPKAALRFLTVLNKIAPPPKKVFRSVRASPSQAIALHSNR